MADTETPTSLSVRELDEVERWMRAIDAHRGNRTGGVIGQAFRHLRSLLAHVRSAPAPVAGITYVPKSLLDKAETERGTVVTAYVELERERDALLVRVAELEKDRDYACESPDDRCPCPGCSLARVELSGLPG